MNYDTKHMRVALQAAETGRSFTEWLATDGDCLASAALLLGGSAWHRRAISVRDAIRSGKLPEDVENDLVGLHRLLTLQYTDDINSPEALRFLAVHPDDPRADDARLCAEALERGLDEMHGLAAMGVREVA
ncbi:hypothetical protein [Marivita sp.]|uniref:hypothetical protein n=1 Tax=Marivita sp. TaxID=2003365 RepID=UPI0025C60B70|nr:hypothetical protein [Marivita sp.]